MNDSKQKRIYIHIGMHKTGTKTIQKGLWLHQEQLSENGIHIPYTGRPFPQSAAQHNLAWELYGFDRFDKKFGTWKDLQKEIDEDMKHSSYILSAEKFEFVNDEESLKKIKKSLEGHEVFIISYIRRQDKVIQSTWAQAIKNPWIKQTKEDIVLTKNAEFAPGYINPKRKVFYLNQLSCWIDAFGMDHVIIRVLEKESLSGHLYHDFLTCCGVDDPQAFEIPANLNVSPGLNTLKAMLWMKFHLFEKLDLALMRFILNQTNKYGDKNGWNGTKLNLIDKKTYSKIMKRHEEHNKQLAQKFFNRDQLFLEKYVEKEITPFNPDDLTKEELIGLIQHLIGRAVKHSGDLSKAGKTTEKFDQLQTTLGNLLAQV